MPGRASDIKMVGMAKIGAPISLDVVAVHPDCWCVCLCYLHFAPENPEDGKMYLLAQAHPRCPGQSPQSCKMVVLCVCVLSSHMTSEFPKKSTFPILMKLGMVLEVDETFTAI